MPPISEQDDDDRAWRLALHRMDLRQYAITNHVAEQHTAASPHDTALQPPHFKFTLNPQNLTRMSRRWWTGTQHDSRL